MTCFSLPLYRQPSSGIGVKYTLLALCRRGMAFFVRFYLLLGVIVLSYFVLIGNKRSYEDISSDNPVDSDNEGDNDKTPTNEKVCEDGDVTPNETVNDISDMKHTLNEVKRALRGDHMDNNSLEDIKEEYSSFFGEDSGNDTDKEALKEIKEYLEGELSESLGKASLAGLSKALDEIAESSNKESSPEASEEPEKKKAKPSDGLSPVD